MQPLHIFRKQETVTFSREPLLFLTVSPIRFYLRFSNVKCQKFLTCNI